MLTNSKLVKALVLATVFGMGRNYPCNRNPFLRRNYDYSRKTKLQVVL